MFKEGKVQLATSTNKQLSVLKEMSLDFVISVDGTVANLPHEKFDFLAVDSHTIIKGQRFSVEKTIL